MLTQTFDGVDALDIDDEILAAIKNEPADPYPGSTKGIAILNAKGQLYRVVGCTSPIAASRTVSRLEALGLIDRVSFTNNTLQEVDSLTGKPLDTPWSAVMQLGDVPHPIPALPRLDLKPV